MKEETTNNKELIDDRFKIVKELGSGGMGSVFECVDINLQKIVAVKILKSFSESHLVRLQNEATVTGAIHHKNIVEVYDFSLTKQSQPYMVMEYIEGVSLSEKIESGINYSFEDLLDIVTQICDGLAFAHSKGILHRDIKPSNVMIIEGEDSEIIVKLVDFGIAKSIDSNQSLTKTGTPIGSPLYMSPEHSHGMMVDHKSDIYSLGCLIYELFSGQPPFTDQSLLELVNKHQNEKSALLFKEPASDFEQLLNAITDRCLQKNKSNRYSSVNKLKDDLLRLSAIDDKGTENSITSIESVSEIGEKKSFNSNLALVISIPILLVIVSIIVLNLSPKDNTRDNRIAESTISVDKEQKLKQSKSLANFLPYKEKNLPRSYKPVFKANKYVSDLDLASFATQHPNTKGLIIRECRVEGHGLKYLKNLPLKLLDISNVSIDSSDLKYIGEIKTLEKLTMSGNINTKKLRGDAYKNLINLSQLKRLDLTKRYVSDEALKWISSISSLERLNLREAEDLNKKGFEHLSKLKNLISLRIDRARVNDSMINSLGTMPIQEIHLDSNLDITSKSLVSFSNYPNLRFLSLAYPTKQNETSKNYFRAISKIKTIDFLAIRNADLKAVNEIENLPQLGTLSFQKQKFTYDNLKQFATFQYVKKLELINDCNFETGALKAIAQLPIETLVIRDTPVSVSELKYLSSAKNLKILELHNIGIASNQLKQMKNIVPKNCKLHIE